MPVRVRRVLAPVAGAVLLAACGSAAGTSAAPPPGSPVAIDSTTPNPTPSDRATTTGPAATPSPGCLSTADVAAWPVARRAASVVVLPSADFDFTALDPELAAGAAGVLFLGSSVAPADLGARIHTAASKVGAPAPLLVMADEEGGGVQRLKASLPNLPWPRDLAASSVASVRSQAAALGRAMAALGVNVDLAPVLDVDSRPGPSDDNPDGSRSFSGDPTVAARYGVAFLEGLRDGGVLPVVKHFPGLGGSTGNTDVRPAATVPLAQLRTTGLPPFQAAIAAGAPAVMISNATVPGMTRHPASLSSAVIGGLLGSQLGFTGLVVTDSLSAGAITAATPSLGQAVADAIESGADLALFGSTRTSADVAALSPARLATSFNQIVATMQSEVTTGALTQDRLNAAVTQVLRARGVPLCG